MTMEEKKALSESLEKKLGCSLSTLAELLRESTIYLDAKPISTPDNSAKCEREERNRITSVLHNLGIPANLLGYTYLTEAILIFVQESEIPHNMSRELYPKIAKKYNTTSTRIDRTIRYAIEVAWRHEDNKLAEEIFSHTIFFNECNPTNRQFIAMLSEYLRSHSTI